MAMVGGGRRAALGRHFVPLSPSARRFARSGSAHALESRVPATKRPHPRVANATGVRCTRLRMRIDCRRLDNSAESRRRLCTAHRTEQYTQIYNTICHTDAHILPHRSQPATQPPPRAKKTPANIAEHSGPAEHSSALASRGSRVWAIGHGETLIHDLQYADAGRPGGRRIGTWRVFVWVRAPAMMRLCSTVESGEPVCMELCLVQLEFLPGRVLTVRLRCITLKRGTLFDVQDPIRNTHELTPRIL